ncbi:hypothetical protein D3C74_283140 [compost metagenome]
MCIFRQNINMIKQFLIHKLSVAFRMMGRETDVFIQIIAARLLEADNALTIQFNQLLVHANGCASGRQTEDGSRFGLQQAGDDSCSGLIKLLLIVYFYNVNHVLFTLPVFSVDLDILIRAFKLRNVIMKFHTYHSRKQNINDMKLSDSGRHVPPPHTFL